MNWLDRLERRFGSWSIPDFPLFIVAANGLIYILMQLRPEFYSKLLLDPSAVCGGEWWRILTFLFVPPPWSPLFVVLWLYLLFVYAQALEHEWGEFKFCFFYLSGAVATIVAAMFVVHHTLSNVALNTSLFFAFASLFPEFQILVFFIIPVKVKHIAWVIWASVIWTLLTGSFSARVALVASLVNYFLFFGPELWETAKLRLAVYRNRRRFRGK
ncbi:MAG TPA: hypothetical protein VMU17_02910 [Elusimicrobiota bacterium]|nr:hypothetical protein [Elusimicrobiota bacterium]